MGRGRVTVLALAASFAAGAAGVYGMFLPPPGYWVDPVGTKAVIWYEGGKETLVVSTSFRGNARDFAWVIPVPAKPEVTAGKDELFTALGDYTRPKQPDYYPQPLGVDMMGVPAVRVEEAVTEYETKRVDIYDISVLSATDKEELIRWLDEKGYEYPANKVYLLTGYIDKGWYFVAAKVSEGAAGYAGAYLQEGHATPLKITFSTDKIIYPLKISGSAATGAGLTPTPIYYPTEEPRMEAGAGSAASGMAQPQYYPPEPFTRPWLGVETLNMVMYVFADKKQTAPGWNTEYAGWVPAKDIEKMAYEDSGEPWMKTGKRKYLTKLTRQMRPAEITDDVVLREASDNEPVGGGSGTDWQSWRRPALVLGVPILAEAAVIWYVLRRRHVGRV